MNKKRIIAGLREAEESYITHLESKPDDRKAVIEIAKALRAAIKLILKTGKNAKRT